MKGILILCLAVSVQACAMEKIETPKRKSSFIEELVNGGFAGCLEVLINNPLIVVKNDLIVPQVKKTEAITQPKSFTDMMKVFVYKYYKGCGTGMASMIPITAFQNSMALVLAQQYGSEKTLTQEASAAMQAGTLSALLSSPADLLVLQRQNARFATEFLFETVKRVWSEKGLRTFYRGITATGLRDGCFTVAYKSGGKLLQEQVPLKSGSEKVDGLIASLLVAVLASVGSQPLDVISAKMKADLSGQTFKSFFSSIYTIQQTEGYASFMKGCSARTARIVLAVPLLNYLTANKAGMSLVNTTKAVFEE